MKTTAVFFAAFILVSNAAAQTSPAQRARQAFASAEQLEAELNEKPSAERSRADVLKVINAYQRVYLITPHTGFADNALITIARLYEEIKEPRLALRTLNFLLKEYPSSPYRNAAERDAARLVGEPERAGGTVENVRFWDTADSIRVVIDLSGDLSFTQGEARNPKRVFLDISPSRLNTVLLGKQWPVQSVLLNQIRVGQYDDSTVRVVFDIGTEARVTSLKLGDPHRLVVDIVKSGTAPVTESSVPVTTAQPARPAAPAPPPKPPATETVVVTPARPTDRGSLSLIRSLGLKMSRVVIDAGHGGHDTGSLGPSGYAEKDLVLDVAQRLKQLITAELGAEVVMTREDDSYVPLEARTAKANQQSADLFISIHANSSRVRSVRGTETYILNFTTSREALETATRENAASESSIHELQDIAQKIMLRDKVEESRELAGHIQKALASRKDAGPNRGVKQAPFVVLIGANIPSVLAEIAFISNPAEERLAKTPEHRQAIAQALLEGVRSYAESLSGVKTAKSEEKIQD
jgi:N-acetylmuramoyl-L-alanine amidase